MQKVEPDNTSNVRRKDIEDPKSIKEEFICNSNIPDVEFEEDMEINEDMEIDSFEVGGEPLPFRCVASSVILPKSL